MNRDLPFNFKGWVVTNNSPCKQSFRHATGEWLEYCSYDYISKLKYNYYKQVI